MLVDDVYTVAPDAAVAPDAGRTDARSSPAAPYPAEQLSWREALAPHTRPDLRRSLLVGYAVTTSSTTARTDRYAHSAYLKLPKMLQFFSGNIGLHHSTI